MSRLIDYFVRGALVLTPIAATLYVLWGALKLMDGLLPVGIPGLGLVLTVALVTTVGFLTSNVIGSTLVAMAERQLARVPLAKLVYSSVKDLVDAFVGESRKFDQPVAVHLDAEGRMKALGFVTRDELTELDQPEHVSVYFPQSYNFAGNVLLVRRDQVEPLSAHSGELMTFIVSGGVSGLGQGEPSPLSSLPGRGTPPVVPALEVGAARDDGPTRPSARPPSTDPDGPTQLESGKGRGGPPRA